jgi:3-polyprenyl-4-hydroxybenzoate decarboxylase
LILDSSAAVSSPPRSLARSRDLGEFLERLRREGELVPRSRRRSTPELEVAGDPPARDRRGGPALSSARRQGSTSRWSTNLFGTQARVELAFGSRPRELIEQAARLPRRALPPTPSASCGQARLCSTALRAGRKRGARAGADVQQDPLRLSRLPALKTLAARRRAFLTLPLVLHRASPARGRTSACTASRSTTSATCGVHMQIGKGGGFHLARPRSSASPLP